MVKTNIYLGLLEYGQDQCSLQESSPFGSHKRPRITHGGPQLYHSCNFQNDSLLKQAMLTLYASFFHTN